jgi:hypothetical protein
MEPKLSSLDLDALPCMSSASNNSSSHNGSFAFAQQVEEEQAGVFDALLALTSADSGQPTLSLRGWNASHSLVCHSKPLQLLLRTSASVFV